MPAGPMSRSAASRASLIAKVALGVLAPAAIAAAVLGLKPIPSPHVDPPDFSPLGSADPAAASVRPVNFVSMGRVLTLAAEFPPVATNPNGTSPGGPPPPPTPTGPVLPVVRFLGAIAEPGRYVALLNIDGRQKFLAPGDVYSRVRVIECTAAEVKVQIEGSSGTEGLSQTIAVAERDGPGWTTGTAPATVEFPAGQPGAEAPAAFPGMPAGFTPPPGMTPEQLQIMKREMEARMRAGGDASQ